MDTREKILAAAGQVIGELGLAGATTREIARAAGYSEATLYKHFADKEELFLTVLGARMRAFVELARGLPQRAGTGTVRDTLTELCVAAIEAYRRTMPLAGGMFAQPRLLSRMQRNKRGAAGPQHAVTLLAAYLRAERELGRVRAGVDPDAVAELLLGACLQDGFGVAFTAAAHPTVREPAELAASLLDAVAPLLTP